MEAKIKTWSMNVSKMEGRQGVLHMKLLELGVSVDSLEKTGPALEGIHFTATVPTVTGVSTLPTATVMQSDLGVPVQVEDTSSIVQADIHPTLASTTVETTGISMQPLVTTSVAQSSDTATT